VTEGVRTNLQTELWRQSWEETAGLHHYVPSPTVELFGHWKVGFRPADDCDVAMILSGVSVQRRGKRALQR